MSYNGYNQYSPYWQQTAGQSTPQSAGQNVGQSRTSYQPLSAYQNNQQSAQPSISSPAETSGGAASYGAQGYGSIPVNGAANGRPQDFRAAYTNTNDRASLDGATVLGNLAYASSLERDMPNQQLSNYSRQQSNSNYRTASPYGINSASTIQNRTGDERRESNSSSREDTNARAPQATASPSFGYTSNTAAYQGSGAGSSMQIQTQYPHSRSTSEQHRVDEYSQPPRLTSGQAIQQSRSSLDSQAALPPVTATTQSTVNQSQGRTDGGSIRGTMQTGMQTPQPSSNRPSSFQTPGQSGGQTQRPQSQQSNHGKGTKHLAKSAVKSKAVASASALATAAKRVSNVRQSPTDANRQSSKPATPVEPQYTTVDPSQVFNHVEYSRRQAAAAAEIATAKKAAEEAEAARIAATQPKPSQVNGTSATSTVPGMEPDVAKKDQMELEMKQMIEKMRDYKAKDPSLFTQIWEQVKKGQPPQRAPSQPFQGSATSPIVVNGQLPSPSLIQSQLPSESDLPTGEFPPDFDRGRFPAQRRRRGGGVKTSTGRKSGIPNSSTKPMAQTQTTESPVPPEIAIPAPKVGQIFPDPGNQSVQQAMQQFHQNSKSPLSKAQHIPGSNKQATTNSSTGPPNATPSTGPHSRTMPAQPAPSLQPGGTYWPESKKKALAEAARNALISTPLNQGKHITTQEIHELLDQNPSYTQMCEILEYRGFIIDRGQFARILLKAVPDLGSASTPANTTSTNSAGANSATHATPMVTAVNDSTTKATLATPNAGSFGKLVKAPSNDSAAQTKLPQPLPYSAPPAAAFQAPNAYVTPYTPTPPSAGQASGGNQSNGIHRDYRFVDPAFWTPDKPHYHTSDSNQGPHGPPSHSHPPFPIYQHSESSGGQLIDQNGTIHPNDVIPHLTKQEMARKRTFGEIVDLTTLSDEEELERHRPKARIDNESALGSNKAVNNIFDQVARRQQNSGRSTPKPFKYKYSGRDALLQSYDVVEPMNKRRDALRRSTYNPKTIARDILLGIGKHPTMAPLNAHLDVLKDRFKAVDNESDLRTFRWDLVDPETEANNMRPSDTDDEEVFPAVTAEYLERPAPTAVMVNGGGGGGIFKDDQTSSGKRGPQKKTSIRSGIQPIGSADTPERQSLPSSPHGQEMSKSSGTISTDLTRFALNSPYIAQKDLTTLSTPNTSTPGSAGKRKGRPPGAKNKQVRPDKGIPKTKKPKTTPIGATPSTAIADALNQEMVEKTTPVGSTSIGKPSSPIPTRPRINTTTPSRPSGLRNSISAMTPSNGIAVVIPSRSPSIAGTSGLRSSISAMTPTDGIAVVIPSRSPSVAGTPMASAKKGKTNKTEDHFEHRSNGTPFSAPTYTMYRCHWETCPAELHSIETLKKHVKKHRRAVDGVYSCLWADCSDSSNPISNNTHSEDGQYQRLKFKTDAEWVTHIESNHLKTKELSPGARSKT